MLVDTDLLSAARAAHQRRDWAASYEAFELVALHASLRTDDLDAFAFAALRLGHTKESSRAAERVFADLTRADPAAAAMKANELGLAWLVRGDVNIGQGWMNRARRLLADAEESPAHGYLTYLDAAVSAISYDPDGLTLHARELRETGRRLDVPAVTVLGLIAGGIDAILQARTADGWALIDEAMVPLVADQVPIEWAGDIYSTVLRHCHKLADLPRMRAWTQSMEQWCGLSGSQPYRGVCEVYRLQVATEDYPGIARRLGLVSYALEDVNPVVAAEGYCQLGEVRRLLGDFGGAATAFAQARLLGMVPQPGEAMLACSRGDSSGAWASIRLALAGGDRLGRARLLRAAVEIALDRDALDDAETYCRELEVEATAFGTPSFLAWAAHARGAVAVRRGQYEQALTSLHAALREYQVQQSRYETAEVYEWMALARHGLGAADAGAADSATAEAIYARLGVAPAGICGKASPNR